jgi:hypothetical protein
MKNMNARGAIVIENAQRKKLTGLKIRKPTPRRQIGSS